MTTSPKRPRRLTAAQAAALGILAGFAFLIGLGLALGIDMLDPAIIASIVAGTSAVTVLFARTTRKPECTGE